MGLCGFCFRMKCFDISSHLGFYFEYNNNMKNDKVLKTETKTSRSASESFFYRLVGHVQSFLIVEFPMEHKEIA